jgi:hypothetical protein
MKSIVLGVFLLGALHALAAVKSPFDHCVDSLHKSGGLSVRVSQELCLKNPSQEVQNCQKSLFLGSYVEPQEAFRRCEIQPLSALGRDVLGYGGQFENLLPSAKKTVCSVTVNSDDEMKLFRKNYDAREYDFVELLPQREADRFIVRDGRWLQRACQAQVKCDILVLSGHFAEAFIGESGFEVSAQDLRESACAEGCHEFFASVKEVYLFGCNTLASKKPDARSIDQYVKILTEDGVNPHKAQRVAARRYTSYANDYFTEMRALFFNAENIFGYPSVGPTGKNVAPTLNRYLQSRIQTSSKFEEIFKTTLGRTGMLKTTGLGRDLCEGRDSVLQKIKSYQEVRQYILSYRASLPVAVVDVLQEADSRGIIQSAQAQELQTLMMDGFRQIPSSEKVTKLCPLILAQHNSFLPAGVDCYKETGWMRAR